MKKAMFQGGLWAGSLFQGGLFLSNGDDVETEAQTVVIDVEDNHGDETYVGIRGIRFFLRGILVQIVSFLAYESSKLSAAYAASNVFDLTKSLTGAWEGNSWIPAEGLTTNQRIIAVFPGKIKFDQMVIHNLHNSGSTVAAGVKALKVAISKSTYTDTTPAAAVTNGETIFEGEIPAHPEADIEAPAEVDYTPPVQTVAEYTVTYAGNSQDSGTAPTDSETYDLGDIVTVLDNTGTLAKTGYTFSGWNTSADGSGTDYAAAATLEISGDTTLYAKWVVASYTAKSVIIDIANNWGASRTGLIKLEFFDGENLITLAPTDYTAYSSSTLSSYYSHVNIFNTSLPKYGFNFWAGGYGWVSNNAIVEIRLIVVFNNSKTFDKIVINNFHNGGAETTNGVKNIKIHTSTDTITSTVYNQAISNSTLIFDGQLAQHVAADQADDQVLDLE